MADKFVVYVFAPPEGEAEAATNKLAELLKLEPSKVRSLVRRLPDVVTRPVSEREATVAGRRFQAAGFEAEIRDAETHALVTRLELERPTETPPTPEAAAPASGVAWADEAGDEPAAPPPYSDREESPEERLYGRSSRIIEPPRDTAADTDPVSGSVAATTEVSPTADAAEETYTDFGTDAADAEPVAEYWQPPEPTPPEPVPAAAQAAAPTAPATTAADAGARARGAVEAAAAAAAVQEEGGRRRRGSLRSKLLSTAIIPVLLTIVGALAATWFTARPALYDQLLESARNPAIATAATLSSTLEGTAGEGIDHLQLLETILITRQAFARQNLSFILATDLDGNPYSGSFLGGTSFPEESLALQNAVRERAIHAVEQGTSGRTGWAEEGATSNVEASGGQRIEIVAQPLMSGNQAIGAVVVGVTDQAVTQQVNRIVINVLLFSLIPLLLAIFIAATRARRLTNNVLTLTQKADEISRGDLDEPVSLRSNDELDDLSAALERMRVSMSGALERLRRRR